MFKGAGTAYVGAILGLLLIAPTGKPQQNEATSSSTAKTPSAVTKKMLETQKMETVQENPVAIDQIALPPPPVAIQTLKPTKKNQRQIKEIKLKAPQKQPRATLSAGVQEIQTLTTKSKPGTAASTHDPIQPLKRIARKPVEKSESTSVNHKALNNPELSDHRKKPITWKSSKEQRAISNVVEPINNATAKRDNINGRALVRMLEHGAGPNIRLAWPDGERNREHLFRMLTNCFGMKTGVMDRDGSVFSEGAAPGTPWPIDLDKYSGFLRHADGLLAPSEAKLVYRIAGRHRLAPQSKVVRIFPRAFDAALLAGIRRIARRDLKERSNVRARYEMTGGGLSVSQIVVNKNPMQGKIQFSTRKNSCLISG